MNQKIINEIGKSQRLKIVNLLKRSQGLSVNELSDRLKMSYMGVKQHCVELEKAGYLDTWRRPKSVGRPELVYRLTSRAHGLFPVSSNEITIDLLRSAQKLYGPAAADKLLLLIFQQKADHYLSRIKGATVAKKAKELAALRDKEGYISDVHTTPELQITEYHTLIQDLIKAFPIVARLEGEMFQRVLGVPVRREEKTVSGLYACVYHIQALAEAGDSSLPEEIGKTPRDEEELSLFSL